MSKSPHKGTNLATVSPAIKTYQAIANQVSCNLDGEAVVLSLTRGTYFGFDAVGARIWGLVQQSRSLEELKAILMEEYEVEASVCESHLRSFLEQLVTNGLVESSEEGAPAPARDLS